MQSIIRIVAVAVVFVLLLGPSSLLAQPPEESHGLAQVEAFAGSARLRTSANRAVITLKSYDGSASNEFVVDLPPGQGSESVADGPAEVFAGSGALVAVLHESNRALVFQLPGAALDAGRFVPPGYDVSVFTQAEAILTTTRKAAATSFEPAVEEGAGTKPKEPANRDTGDGNGNPGCMTECSIKCGDGSKCSCGAAPGKCCSCVCASTTGASCTGTFS